jgi:predicted alpha/beta hydrolase family esterase
MASPILILPGIGDSGPGHWQTLWEQGSPAMQRVHARDWEQPICAEWVAALEAAVEHSGPQAVLVAHSLACLQVAHWSAGSRLRIRAALLVAVPDPAGPSFPAQAQGFAPIPLQRLAFPSIVVASSDDPHGSIAHARRCAQAWGSRLVEIGAAGHINAGSGLGEWPQGRALLDGLLAGLAPA